MNIINTRPVPGAAGRRITSGEPMYNYLQIVNERLHAALRNEAVWDKAAAAGINLSDEPTAGEVLQFVMATGSDPVLLLCGVEDVLRGLDDLPSFDTHSA